ncbi:hypothetical protein [Aeromonas sp. 600724]|uniref:hypothetical protein n=1 Tax=Aeromonas sp. 600724 TaxID=2712031 RepID=UPI003BA2905B
MDKNIQAIVNNCSNLTLKINLGPRYRVSKNGMMHGSLWLEVQQECYRLKLTGEPKLLLTNFINTITNQKPTFDQGNPVWHLSFDGEMEKIVKYLNEI